MWRRRRRRRIGDGWSGDTANPPADDGRTEERQRVIKGASIRLVNAFAPDGKGEPITAYAGREAKPGDRPFVTVAFGEVSQFFEPPAVGRSLFSIPRHCGGDPRDRMTPVEETFLEGDRATLLVTAPKDSEGRQTAGGQTFFERGNPNSRPSTPPVTDEALIFANATVPRAGWTQCGATTVRLPEAADLSAAGRDLGAGVPG